MPQRIHVFCAAGKTLDGRNKSGHDALLWLNMSETRSN
jgi:hypothetical protein